MMDDNKEPSPDTPRKNSDSNNRSKRAVTTLITRAETEVHSPALKINEFSVDSPINLPKERRIRTFMF